MVVGGWRKPPILDFPIHWFPPNSVLPLTGSRPANVLLAKIPPAAHIMDSSRSLVPAKINSPTHWFRPVPPPPHHHRNRRPPYGGAGEEIPYFGLAPGARWFRPNTVLPFTGSGPVNFSHSLVPAWRGSPTHWFRPVIIHHLYKNIHWFLFFQG